MRRFAVLVTVSVVFAGLASAAPQAAARLPLAEGREVVAQVNGEPVWLDELVTELAALHGSMAEPATHVSRKNPLELLDRLIDVRLVVQEGRNIGLDELPEAVATLDAYRAEALRDELFRVHTSAMTVADPQEVERRYRAQVEELELRSALVADEATARSLAEALRGGADFGAEIARLAAAGKLQDSHEPRFVRRTELRPEVAAAVAGSSPGSIAGPLRVGSSYTVVAVSARRYPDDPPLRQAIEREVLHQERSAAARAYVAALVAEHARVDEALLAGLDFEAPTPGFERLLRDERPLARVAGEDPVTVAELAAALRKKFFHGVERASGAGRINARKAQSLEDLLQRRVVLREARRQKLDRTQRYRDRVRSREESLVFNLFVQRIIDPALRVDDDELRGYIAAHAEEFTTPEMMRLERLTLLDRADAEATLERLNRGANFDWVRENARGQAPADAAGTLDLPQGPVVVATLPAELRAALRGAAEGAYRFFPEAGGPYHVIRVREVLAPQPQPFDALRDAVRGRVINERRQAALADWTRRLRDVSEIVIHLTREGLEERLGLGGAR